MPAVSSQDTPHIRKLRTIALVSRQLTFETICELTDSRRVDCALSSKIEAKVFYLAHVVPKMVKLSHVFETQRLTVE
jgi:hypothetical protein